MAMTFRDKAANVLSAEAITNRRDALQAMMRRTLVSLLHSYRPEDQKFVGIRRDGQPSQPTYRDTALVLTAIEEFASPLMDHGVVDAQVAPQSPTAKEVRAFTSKLSPAKAIASEPYRRLIFEPAAAQIAVSPFLEKSGESLGSHADSRAVSPDPFTSAVILEFLTHYRKTVTHQENYAITAGVVVDALSKLHPPQRQFGGVSMTGVEPHAFISYICIRSLNSIVDSLRQRAAEHKVASGIVEDILQWREPSSNVRLAYASDEEFKVHVRRRITELDGAVGIDDLIKAMGVELPALLGGGSGTALLMSHELGTNWLTDYRARVAPQLERIATEVNGRRTPLSAEPMEPRDWRRHVDDAKRDAEAGWKAFFLQGMIDLSIQLEAAYTETPSSPSTPAAPLTTVDVWLTTILGRLEKAAKVLTGTADQTHTYLQAFQRWGTAELQRQLAFYAGRQHTNFDPIQLLFAARIHDDFSATPDKGLVLEALAILADTQQPDGSWAGDAPFLAAPDSSAGIYVAGLEAMNALLPLVDKYGWFESCHMQIERTFRWLETNERKLVLDGATISGWATEKANDPERIDAWMSALALQFTGRYGDLLQDLLKKKAASWYDLKPPAELGPALDRLTDSDVGEPLQNRVRRQIGDAYVEPFLRRRQNDRSSLLLYGPPGTAKSTFAEAIARSLNWTLVTITPSDFVKRGLERSEYWARRIFDDLLQLRNTVVFFDEIDEMLRSRSLAKGQGTAGMLQFIVPGMLPKLQNLKKYGEKAPLMIVIATNYQDRLDPAITRAGRIDEKIAVMPPDFGARQLLLRDFFGKRFALDKRGTMQLRNTIVTLSKFTGGWTFKELQDLVARIQQRYAAATSAQDLATYVEEICKRLPALDDSTPLTDGRIVDGFTLLDRSRALSLRDWYGGRGNGAIEEAARALRICGPQDRANLEDRSSPLWNAAQELCKERVGA